MTLDEAIQIMSDEIATILADNKPTIYIFGSVALGDFKLCWSDIDILVLTKYEISEQQAAVLVSLRQDMLKSFPDNPYFRLFEGGILSVNAFLNNENERTVYWGTSGQRIITGYRLDSFGMAELLDSGILICGNDIRHKLRHPAYAQIRDDIANHTQVARKHGTSVGWLLDIARGFYTLRTGKVITKTAAGEWALENEICPDVDTMQKAVAIRKQPHLFSKEDKEIDNTIIQRFADVIEHELAKTLQRLVESELQHMGINHKAVALIRSKDGVSVWRVQTDETCYVIKCFEKAEHSREIANYHMLIAHKIPTLKMIAHTKYSIVLEDIEQSKYRLGVPEDMNDPQTAKLIATWYKTLHENGRRYADSQSLYDECDHLTTVNIATIKERTNTKGLRVWNVMEENFDTIKSAAMNLPRTITYNDFYYTNLAVAKDDSAAIVFDYNLLGKGYVYADIRNVCSSLGEDAKMAFLSEYGDFDENEKVVDDVVSHLITLHFACERKTFPNWAAPSLEIVKDGRLLLAVEQLLRICEVS